MRRLVVFLKAPRAGEVKTRLAASIGDPLAVEVYRALTSAVMEATRPTGISDFTRVVCFAPADAADEIAAWFGDEPLLAQAPGDLGHRMDQAFAHSFASGAEATVIVGTDSLAVDHAAIAGAFSGLDTADVIPRRARDGALARAHVDVLRADTGTSQVSAVPALSAEAVFGVDADGDPVLSGPSASIGLRMVPASSQATRRGRSAMPVSGSASTTATWHPNG